MYSRILVPLDGSPLAEQVLPYVRVLALRLNAPITLLRAFGPVPDVWADPAHGLYLDRLIDDFRDKAQDYLSAVGHNLRDLGVSISIATPEGGPARHIIEEAEKLPDTLITMCTHGRSGIGRWLLGSITEKILLATSNPLLVFRARDQQEPSFQASLKTVIVPLDGSPLAEQVLPHVVRLASALELNIQLVRAVPRITEYLSEIRFEAPVLLPPFEKLDEEANKYLEGIAHRLLHKGKFSIECRVLHGPADAAIVDYAKEVSDNLVAMTTHGRTGMGRWLLGSVADRVVRYCGDPVLVIRPQ
ncbi:MAG: universal stress protein [Chloroflexi bacterium]|nr:universal stress protein [Chloroflexota bacterium]